MLALTLRDLIEGDIPMGFGAAKGYGACTATIEALEVSEHLGGLQTWVDSLELEPKIQRFRKMLLPHFQKFRSGMLDANVSPLPKILNAALDCLYEKLDAYRGVSS